MINVRTSSLKASSDTARGGPGSKGYGDASEAGLARDPHCARTEAVAEICIAGTNRDRLTALLLQLWGSR